MQPAPSMSPLLHAARAMPEIRPSAAASIRTGAVHHAILRSVACACQQEACMLPSASHERNEPTLHRAAATSPRPPCGYSFPLPSLQRIDHSPRDLHHAFHDGARGSTTAAHNVMPAHRSCVPGTPWAHRLV
jgi:hypothetical protein